MITYQAITKIDPERDVLRCLPETLEGKQALLNFQGALGIGSYENELFMGSVWFYRMEDNPSCPYTPEWSEWHKASAGFLQLNSLLSMQAYPLLGLGCFHVG